jgi:DNA-binding transcriptional ArsR family regulator
VSRHLAVLKQAGLASSERTGRRVVYTLDAAALRGLGRDVHTAFLR